jgi:hypothetical protein
LNKERKMTTARNSKTSRSKIAKTDVKEIEKLINSEPDEVKQLFHKLLYDLENGLPPATTGELLNSRVKW